MMDIPTPQFLIGSQAEEGEIVGYLFHKKLFYCVAPEKDSAIEELLYLTDDRVQLVSAPEQMHEFKHALGAEIDRGIKVCGVLKLKDMELYHFARPDSVAKSIHWQIASSESE